MTKHTLHLTDEADERLEEMRKETGGLSIGKIISHLITGWPRGKQVVAVRKRP